MDKVLYVLPSTGWGGAERIALAQIRGLLGEGFPVEVVLPRTEANRRVHQELQDLAIPLRVVPRVENQSSTDSRRSPTLDLDSLAVSARSYSAILALLPYPDQLEPIVDLALVADRPLVVDFQLCPDQFQPSERVRRMTELALKKGHLIVSVPSDTTKARLSSWIPADEIQVLENRPTRNLTEFAEVSNLIVDSKSREVLYCGRLDPQKQPDLLLRAFARVKRLVPEARLTFLGSGNLTESLTKLSIELGVSSDVSFQGETDNPIAELKKARVVCFPSDYEGLPLTLWESLYAGGANLVSDIPEHITVLNHFGNAGTFRRGEEASIAAELLVLLEDDHVNQVVRTFPKQFEIETYESFTFPKFVERLFSLINLNSHSEFPEQSPETKAAKTKNFRLSAHLRQQEKVLVVLDPYSIFQRRNGSWIRQRQQISDYQKQGASVTVAIISVSATPDELLRTARGLREELGVSSLPFYSKAYFELHNGLELLVGSDVISEFQKVVEVLKPDIIHYNRVRQYLLALSVLSPEPKQVLDMHDVFSFRQINLDRLGGLLWDGMSLSQVGFDAVQPSPLSLTDTLESTLLEEEHRRWQAFDEIQSLTNEDSAFLRSLGFRNVVEKPFFANYRPKLRPKDNGLEHRKPTRSVFIGSKNLANAAALAMIRNHLDVSGMHTKSHPPPVKVIGEVSNFFTETKGLASVLSETGLDRELEKASLYVAPFPFSSGQSIGISTARARGMPVVCFEQVGSRHGLIHGKDALLASNVYQFRQCLNEYFENEELQLALSLGITS